MLEQKEDKFIIKQSAKARDPLAFCPLQSKDGYSDSFCDSSGLVSEGTMDKTADYTYDAIVIGAGHAGIEAALVLSRTGNKTLCLSITLDNVGYLACNPSIGGTAKGHLVREIDALGGEMGRAADKTLTQIKMLNASKGPAVHSLRAQVDKYKYHQYMKNVLENTPGLHLIQGEVKELIERNGKIAAVKTVYNEVYFAKTVVVASGVYLDSTIIVGDVIEKRGPVCFNRSNYLGKSLQKIGVSLRRFKTGTPARVKRSSIDLDKLEIQRGENVNYTFSALSKRVNFDKAPCYLGYTNKQTHSVIEKNLSLSPKYGGLIHGVGARYCPSIEDKVVRFKDKERHQFFLEPEGEGTEEMYVQGLSTSLPTLVQLQLYRTIEGFENVEIMRAAYAIEYECINPIDLYPTLMHKNIEGLFFAGQINGTSGYEEAAAQGIVAGINASLYAQGKAPLIFTRENSYIGVLIDDLVTEGTVEPYRMMTSRAEFRLSLRQDNADLRLTQIGRDVGLVCDKRYKLLLKRKRELIRGREKLNERARGKRLKEFFEFLNEPVPQSGMSFRDLIKRTSVNLDNYSQFFDTFKDFSRFDAEEIFIEEKYAGYLAREKKLVEETARLEKMQLDKDTDYSKISGLRIEAREKLASFKPLSIGQASRISGVTPADVNVLIITFNKKSLMKE